MDDPSLEADGFFPVRVERLARSLGWSIEGVSGIGYWEGRPILGRCVHAEKRIDIAIDASASSGEQLFTLAHEIGHILLGHQASPCHGQVARVQPVRTAGSRARAEAASREEVEADRFATCLLMPEKTVRNRFQALFGRESLWVGSRTARELIPKLAQKDWVRISPRDVAPAIATFAPEGERSLVEYFGASKAAMARRLIELGLVI